MVAARRIIAVSVDADQHRTLVEISRSRTEPANRVERAGIILAYLDEPSAYAVARAIGVSQQTVTRCLQRAAELGVSFVKGSDFLLDGGHNTLRLAYSGVTPEQIDEGVTRLAAAYRSL